MIWKIKLYSRAWAAIVAAPRAYGHFAQEHPQTSHFLVSVLEKCKEERAEKSLKLVACKSDFRHAGLFRKVETFPELPENKGGAS